VKIGAGFRARPGTRVPGAHATCAGSVRRSGRRRDNGLAGGGDWGGYTVDEAALRHGAGVEEETDDPKQAYARFRPSEPTRYGEGWLPELGHG
jgi:hypothetical protein